MVWCPQGTSHFLSQCCSSSVLSYGVTSPQGVKWNCNQNYQILIEENVFENITCRISVILCLHVCHFSGLVQDCSNSIANAMELLQLCTKPLIYINFVYFLIWDYTPEKCHYFLPNWRHLRHFNGLVQDCSNSIANAMELLQSCAKPPLCINIVYSLIWDYTPLFSSKLAALGCGACPGM